MKSEPLAILAAKVAALEQRVRMVEGELSRGRRVGSSTDAVPPLALIDGRVGDSAWSCTDLRAAIVQARDTELAAALDALGSPKRFGRLLARSVGRDIDGFRVQRVGGDEHGALWRVSRN